MLPAAPRIGPCADGRCSGTAFRPALHGCARSAPRIVLGITRPASRNICQRPKLASARQRNCAVAAAPAFRSIQRRTWCGPSENTCSTGGRWRTFSGSNRSRYTVNRITLSARASTGNIKTARQTDCPCKEGLPVTNLEAGCENKCASPYIGERFGENSVGGKWLMGKWLRILLTLLGRGKERLGG